MARYIYSKHESVGEKYKDKHREFRGRLSSSIIHTRFNHASPTHLGLVKFQQTRISSIIKYINRVRLRKPMVCRNFGAVKEVKRKRNRRGENTEFSAGGNKQQDEGYGEEDETTTFARAADHHRRPRRRQPPSSTSGIKDEEQEVEDETSPCRCSSITSFFPSPLSSLSRKSVPLHPQRGFPLPQRRGTLAPLP